MFRALQRSSIACALALALTATTARAQPAAPAPTTAADVADKPRPDRARNIVRQPRSWTRHLLWVPRGILFVPKWALWAGVAPVRGALWAYDRYSVGPRIAQLLSGDGPVTLVPSAKLESDFGITYGVALATTDALGAHERLRFKFLFGGEARQVYGGKLTTGTLLGDRVEAELDVELQLLRNSQYFGIGNDDDAVATRYDQDVFRAELAADVHAACHVGVRASTAFVSRDFFDPSDADALRPPDVYGPDELLGFDTGTDAYYTELAATYDNRRQPSRYISAAEPSTGWRVSAFAGYAHGVQADPSRYVRLGVDVQRLFDLYGGDRVLVLRGQAETVTAGVDELPFADLPALGDSRIMRAYSRGRFRDRTIGIVGAEYRYPVHRFIQAFAFAEAGSALSTPGDASLSGLHPSYGAGLELHTPVRFLMRFHAAYGDDGVRLALSFSPAFELRRRTKRR